MYKKINKSTLQTRWESICLSKMQIIAEAVPRWKRLDNKVTV